MGGKVMQTNPQQASGAYAGATDEAKKLDSQATQNLATQNAYMQHLFGAVGSDGKMSGGGTLTPLTDPSTLSRTSLGPTYDYLYKQEKGQIAQGAQQNASSLRENMSNRGFAAGSGMENAENTKLALGTAEAGGRAFGDAFNAQHSEDLNNFWNSNSLMSGNAATIGAQGTADMQSAASTYNNLYGVAGQGHFNPGIGAALIGAAGTVGAAFCPAIDSHILISNTGKDVKWKLVQDLRKGDTILGIDGEPDELLSDPEPVLQHAVEIRIMHLHAKVSSGHTFAREKGGYAFAGSCEGELVKTIHGQHEIQVVRGLAEKIMCYPLFLKRSHGYCVDGFWSLE